MRYILILLFLTNLVFTKTESKTKSANGENNSVVNYTSVHSRSGGWLPRIIRFLKRIRTKKPRQSIWEAELLSPEVTSQDISEVEKFSPEIKLPTKLSTPIEIFSSITEHTPQTTIETTPSEWVTEIFEPTIKNATLITPIYAPLLDLNSSLLIVTAKIIEMNELMALLSETVNLIYQNATRLEEARVHHMYHNCATLIVDGDFTRALEVYNRLSDKESSTHIIVEIAIKSKSSAIYEIVSFIFKTRSGSKDVNLALKTLYNRLIYVGLMHILNTLIFYKTVSIYDINSTFHIRILLYERLVWLCENNAFMELYKYGNDDGNIHILNQLLPIFVEVTYKLYDLTNAFPSYRVST